MEGTGSPLLATSTAAFVAARGNEQGSERAQRVPIKFADQPQALSEQETEATPSAGHPFGSSQEFVRGPRDSLACMGRRETMGG